LEIVKPSKKNELYASTSMILLMISVITSYFFRDSFGIKIPDSFFYAIYFIGFLILNRKELLQFFIFLVPLSNGPLLYYLNVVFGIFFILKNVHYIKINHAIIVSFILVLWEAFHLLPNAFLGYNESIIKLFGFVLCLIVATIAISNTKTRNSYISILYAWCIGFSAFCTIMLVKYIYHFGLSNFPKVVRRFGWIPASLDYSSTSLLINPNGLGKLVTLTVFCLLTITKFERKFSSKMIFSIIYLILFGIMSGSRSFLVVFTVLSFTFILELILKPKQNKKLIQILIIVLILIMVFVPRYMQSTLSMISRRLQSDDITGSRLDIYKQYINELKKSPYIIFGSGMQDYNEKYNISYSSHNLFIEVISIWGIIGLMIAISWFAALYKSLKLQKRIFLKNRTLLPLLPALGLFLYSQAGQFFISYYNTFPTVIIAFLNIKYAESKLENDC